MILWLTVLSTTTRNEYSDEATLDLESNVDNYNYKHMFFLNDKILEIQDRIQRDVRGHSQWMTHRLQRPPLSVMERRKLDEFSELNRDTGVELDPLIRIRSLRLVDSKIFGRN